MKILLLISISFLSISTNCSILKKRTISIQTRFLDDENVDTEQIQTEQENQSNDQRSKKTDEEESILDEHTTVTRDDTSDKTIDVSSAEFSENGNLDQANKKIKERMDNGDDILELEKRDNHIHDASETEKEKLKKEEMKKNLEALSDKSDILTEEKLQQELKTSLLKKDRNRVDIDKDTERLNNNTGRDSNEFIGDLRDETQEKNRDKQENVNEVLDPQAENIQEKVVTEINSDLSADSKKNINIYAQSTEKPGILAKPFVDPSVRNSDNDGSRPSVFEAYDLYNDPDIKLQNKEYKDVMNIKENLENQAAEEDAVKDENTFSGVKEFIEKKGIKPLETDDVERYEFPSITEKFQKEKLKENPQKNNDMPEIPKEEVLKEIQNNQNNKVEDTHETSGENLNETNDQEMNDKQENNQEQNHDQQTVTDENQENNEKESRENISIFTNLIMVLFMGYLLMGSKQ